MLVAFAFRAKQGKEEEFEAVLNNAEAGRRVAEALGATRNTLFLREGRMIRILEFPEGAPPKSLMDVARQDSKVMDFLRKLGPLIEDGYDLERPGSMEAFNARIGFSVAYDVVVDQG